MGSGRGVLYTQDAASPGGKLQALVYDILPSTTAVYPGVDASHVYHSSGAVRESRWTSWAVRPNEPSFSMDVKNY